MLSNRWFILLVLFLARLMMAFQFQSVAALSPLLMPAFGIGLADIGFLIGLYFAPGIFFALPGGAVAARFGDKHIVALGMVLMLVGAVVIAVSQNYQAFVGARFVVGAGGVILNVVMTKMLVDWFGKAGLSTAMAIYINSWPIGIALALVVLPWLAASGGLGLAWWVLSVMIGASLLLFVLTYHSPDDAADTVAEVAKAAFPVTALVLAGVVWALYNTALAMVFSFAPAFLVQVGYALTQAGSLTSLFMILFSIALPIGGIIADRTGRKDLIIYVSLISFTVLMPIAVLVPSLAFMVFCGIGVLFAFGAGPVMTLPAEVLSAQSRAFGMGIFFTIYYVLMMIGPRIGGGIADALGDAGAAILTGAVMSFGAVLALWGFRIASRR